MTAAKPAAAKQVTKPRRWRRWLLLVLVLLVVALSITYLARFALFGERIKNAIADALANTLQAQVTIDHIEGSLLSDVTITGVSLQARSSKQALQAASLAKLHCDYDLWGLINGFDIDDIHSIHVQDLDLNIQESTVTNEETRQVDPHAFDPALIAPFINGRLPQVAVNGRVHFHRHQTQAALNFDMNGDDQAIAIQLSECHINGRYQTVGPMELKRLDRHSFKIHAPHFHRSIQLKNARLTVTPGFVDLRLPLTIAQQRQSIHYRYSKEEQDLECHLDFHWRETPPILRSFIPVLLPVRGHSRIVGNINYRSDATDLSCIIQADNLTWQLNERDQITASIHAFMENNAEQCRIEINDIDISAPNHHFSINKNVHIKSENHKEWHIDKTSITTNSGGINIGGTISLEQSDFSLSWDQIDLAIVSKAFALPDMSGLCNGSLYIGGDLKHPTIKITAAVPKLGYADREFEIDISCSQSKEGIEIDHCFINYKNHAKLVAIGAWPRFIGVDGLQFCDGHDAKLSVDIDAEKLEQFPELNGIISDGSIHGTLELTYKDEKPLFTSAINIRDLSFSMLANHDEFVLNGEHRIRLDNSAWQSIIRIDQNDRNYLHGTVKGDAPAPLLELANWDQNWNAFLDTCKGQLDFKDLFFKLEGTIPRIGDINGRIIMDGRRISVDKLQATLGFEPVIIDGYVLCGYPHISEANVRVQGSRVLLVQSPGLRLRSDANLSIQKSDQTPLSLKGQLNIVDALYSEDFITTNRHSPEVDSQFQLFSLPESFLGGAALDIAVSAKRSIRIRNSMLRADASGELRIRGTGAVPEPAGDILIHEDNAKLTLPFSTIWFNPSTITFKASQPFNPSFFISGHTKMQGYDLRIQLEGTMSDFSVNGIDIVSNPPLSAEEATRLITTGIPPRNIFDTGKDIDTSGLVIGWAIVETLRKVFGSGDPDKEKLINNIEVQIGRDVSDNGYNTIEVIAPLPNNFFLKVERDKYEDYNADIGIRKEW